jgi:hypothetical protein
MKRVRKAVTAALATIIGSLTTALVNGDQPATTEGWAALVGGAVGLGVVAGIATYTVRNEGPGINPVTGSEPSRLYRRGDPV